MSRAIVRILRLALGVGIAAALMTPLNVLADDSSIHIVSAKLVARGVEVDVTVSFTCPAGNAIGSAFGGGLSASIQQAVSKSQQAAGSGFTSQPTVCTGSSQTGVIQVLAIYPGPPFRTGPAVVIAGLNDCTPDFVTCSFTSTGFTTVRVTK